MKKLFALLVVAFLMVSPMIMVAQGPPGNPGGPGGSGVPLDGGISAIIVAGVAFGVKEIRSRKKA